MVVIDHLNPIYSEACTQTSVKSFVCRLTDSKVCDTTANVLIQHSPNKGFRPNEPKSDKDIKRAQIERRLHPKFKGDFDLLYYELELWRRNEIEKLRPVSRGTQAIDVLIKETKLLRKIENMQREAGKRGKCRKLDRALSRMSHPKSWTCVDGSCIEVETCLTKRSRQLRILYHQLIEDGKITYFLTTGLSALEFLTFQLTSIRVLKSC